MTAVYSGEDAHSKICHSKYQLVFVNPEALLMKRSPISQSQCPTIDGAKYTQLEISETVAMEGGPLCRHAVELPPVVWELNQITFLS